MSDQPALAADAAIARAEGLVASEVNGEIVVLSIELGHFFHLNATGSRIWNLLTAPMTWRPSAPQWASGSPSARRNAAAT